MKKSQSGFTLIEILVALAVFGILAAITSSTMYYAFTTRTRVTDQADRMVTLELAFTLIERDTEQSTLRAVRGNDMRLFPIFVGQPTYMEFTRSGLVNPGSEEKRSTLKRIAIICAKNKLVRRSWDSLDSSDRNAYKDSLLLDRLTKCQFAYLNKNQDILDEWRQGQTGQDLDAELLPKAVRLTLTLENWGEQSLLFILPKGLYANYNK